ncbi:MAG TPA: glycoside hydrolase family 3 N-terminal domain-containing protein [Solirubrobacteraceae bacterium]
MIDSVDADQRVRRRRRRDAVRRRRLRLGVAALVAFVAGAVLGAGGGGDEPGRGRPAAASEPAQQARAAVDRLSLEQQVGHMVILRFEGTQPPGYVRRAVRQGRVAGVILFRDNVVSPGQMRQLTRALPGAIVCVDQEGGDVRTLSWAAPAGTAAEQEAAGTVREDARSGARDLKAAGVNVTLAPVADVPSVDGAALAGRAFSSDPEDAARAVTEAIEGWHDGGVATTVKHFPGLGGATVNTDDGPATIKRSEAELEADLAPFKAAIAAGTEYVMTGHATYPALDGLHIASQSPAIIDGLLRHDLGFDGVVMTDSLEAAAVQAVGDVEEAAVASAQAGVDLILTTGRGSYIHVYRALLAKARQDPEFRRRVRASAARVLAAQ